jgi:hypothetical protein
MRHGRKAEPRRLEGWTSGNFFLLGLASLVWYLLRTGLKPSRAVYPCQQAARFLAEFWMVTYLLPVYMVAKALADRRTLALGAAVIFVAGAALVLSMLSPPAPEPQAPAAVEPDTAGAETFRFPVASWGATAEPASDVYVVNGTDGGDGGFTVLLELMASKGEMFYNSESEGPMSSPDGVMAADDVVIVKVNCQWDQRGGTNTDLLKELIETILEHPDGFTGEIVVADNGQAQGGSDDNGGSLDWSECNAKDHSQSAQRVVESLASRGKVSTYLWDTITTNRVDEYMEGDYRDGYVVNGTRNTRTGIMVSYPKFTTVHGTMISFKHGVWDNSSASYDSERLKVISVPVLKTHVNYGVTGAVKHYMGVPSDRLTRELGARTHSTIGRGSMGTLMAETRLPALTIMDAIWVNCVPLAGPWSDYDSATKLHVIAASADPAALDYYASKHLLLVAWRERSGETSLSIDPDNSEPGFFGNWLRLSMEELNRAGIWATMDPANINVYAATR